ncbi:MAG: hypothetical protein II851_07245 [Bacteroidales bacterium]|nr:hypothetical protein [Bacteroidales bacterium]
MKRSIILRMAALCVGALVLSCVQEPLPAESEITVPEGDLISFTAILEQDGTRTSLDAQMQVLWNDGDKIRVFTAARPAGAEYELTGGAGSSTGTFTGPDPGDGPYYAVYPADAGVSLEGTSLHVTVPATQTWAEGSFGAGANLAAGKGESLEALRLRNLAGTLALKFTGSKKLSAVRIFVPVGETLHGTAVVSGWDAEAPTLQFDAGQTGEEFAQVTLSCGSAGVQLSSQEKAFHIVLPVGTLAGGFFIEAVDTEGNALVRHSLAGATPAIVRSQVRPMPVLAYTAKYKDAFLTETGAGAFSKASAASSGAFGTLCRYVEGKSQYAWQNAPGETGTRYLRLEDWEDGFALSFSTPYELTPGRDSKISLVSLGNTGVSNQSNVTMRVVKQFGERVWLCDTQSGNGYIMLMINEED